MPQLTRKPHFALAAALALAGTMLAGATAAEARPRMTGEEKLAKLLEGREPGEPVDCIPLNRVQSSQVFDKTAIAYDIGRVIYVNRPPVGANSLDDDDVLLTRLHSSNLCSIDTVQLLDRNSLFYSGFVGLGEFVPYRKVKTAVE